MFISSLFTHVYAVLCKKVFLQRKIVASLAVRPAVSKKKKSKSWDEYEAQNFFSNMIAFEKGFFFDRRAGRVHSSIFKKFPYILLEFNSGYRPANGRPSLGHQILMSKFQTFLKVFEKNDGKVILMSTNIIMGQLNIKDYEYDNGITIF